MAFKATELESRIQKDGEDWQKAGLKSGSHIRLPYKERK